MDDKEAASRRMAAKLCISREEIIDKIQHPIVLITEKKILENLPPSQEGTAFHMVSNLITLARSMNMVAITQLSLAANLIEDHERAEVDASTREVWDNANKIWDQVKVQWAELAPGS